MIGDEDDKSEDKIDENPIQKPDDQETLLGNESSVIIDISTLEI